MLGAARSTHELLTPLYVANLKPGSVTDGVRCSAAAIVSLSRAADQAAHQYQEASQDYICDRDGDDSSGAAGGVV